MLKRSSRPLLPALAHASRELLWVRGWVWGGGGACTKVDELLWGSQVSDQTISAQSKNNTETHKYTQDTTYLLALGFSSGVKVIDMGVSSSAGGHMLAWVRLEVVYCATSAGDRVGRGGGILACNPQPCSG